MTLNTDNNSIYILIITLLTHNNSIILIITVKTIETVETILTVNSLSCSCKQMLYYSHSLRPASAADTLSDS